MRMPHVNKCPVLRVSKDPSSCGPASHPSPSEAAERAAHLLWNTQLYILYYQDQLTGNTQKHTHTQLYSIYT